MQILLFVPQQLMLVSYEADTSILRVNVCDRPAKYEDLKAEYADQVRDLQIATGVKLTISEKSERLSQWSSGVPDQ